VACLIAPAAEQPAHRAQVTADGPGVVRWRLLIWAVLLGAVLAGPGQRRWWRGATAASGPAAHR
jgi:hypothetical protein